MSINSHYIVSKSTSLHLTAATSTSLSTASQSYLYTSIQLLTFYSCVLTCCPLAAAADILFVHSCIQLYHSSITACYQIITWYVLAYQYITTRNYTNPASPWVLNVEHLLFKIVAHNALHETLIACSCRKTAVMQPKCNYIVGNSIPHSDSEKFLVWRI